MFQARISRRMVGAMATAAIALTSFTGCNSIFEESDCVESYNLITLTYDYNMKRADAFVHEVDEVSLLAFDSKTGLLVSRIDRKQSDLIDGNTVELTVAPGEYDILVWAGDPERSFEIADGEIGRSTLADFHARLKAAGVAKDGGVDVDEDLGPLFHGLKHVSLPYASPSRPNKFTMGLTKDTNVVRVVLQNINGEYVNHEDFTFTITDHNSWLNADNTLRDATTAVGYHPWHLTSGAVDVNTNPIDPSTGRVADFGEWFATSTASSRAVLGASLAEFTVNRLFMENNPRLHVTDRNGKTILNVSLRDYALLVKGFYHEDMSDQEYLDRQDEYNMTFFLDDGNRWISAVIIINDWRIVRYEGSLE